jgi:hypothetical protein
VGDGSHVDFVHKFPGEKVHCHDATAHSFASKVWEKVFVHFQSPYNVTAGCGTNRLACQDEFFVNNNLDIKQNDEHTLHFVLHLSCLFQSR